MEIPLEYVAFIGIVLGIIGRTYFPYLKKVKEAEGNKETITFDAHFILTAIFSGVITGIFVYPLFVIPEGSLFNVFLAAFVFAWSANDLVNRVSK